MLFYMLKCLIRMFDSVKALAFDNVPSREEVKHLECYDHCSVETILLPP